MENREPKNYNIAHTQITPLIRVSTAGIFYDEWTGKRWQIETFVFSDDPRIKTNQVIYGSASRNDDEFWNSNARESHKKIVRAIEKKLSTPQKSGML